MRGGEYRSQGSGAGSQELGARIQESEVRIQKTSSFDTFILTPDS